MKREFRIKAGFLVISLFLAKSLCFAQLDQVGKFIAAGQNDAKFLLQSYISPAVNAFGTALGSGWYNTASAHKLGGFDLTLTINTGIIPKKFESFKIDNSQLSLLQLTDPNNNTSPSVAGKNETGPSLEYNLPGYTGPAFDMPNGLNVNFVPTPMVQAGVGLIKGTELMGRYLPNIHTRGNEIGLWGLGVKHDVKQWIPGLKHLPVLQLSVMYGYTRLHTFINTNITPDQIGAGGLSGANSNAWDNQQVQLITNSQTANLIVSANLPVICLYGGIGFVTTKTDLKLKGDFPVVSINGATPVVTAITDPLSMSIKNRSGGVTKPRFNAGIRFKLAVVTIHFDYSWSDYSELTAGLGVSFR